MANSLMQQAHSLKQLVEQAKQQSTAARESALSLLKIQHEKDKREVSAMQYVLLHLYIYILYLYLHLLFHFVAI